jgi:hypothetical protein
MRIFLSHKSRDKQTVKKFKESLHPSLFTWIDDESLRWGENLVREFSTAIQSEVDFLVLFINSDTLDSAWVRDELEWALQRERELERNFVLSIVLPDAIRKPLPKALTERKYLTLKDYDDLSIQALAEEANYHLMSLIIQAYSNVDRFFVKSYPFVADARQDILECITKAKETITMAGVCLAFLQPSDFKLINERAAAGVDVILCIANPASPKIEEFKKYLYPSPITGDCPTKESVCNVLKNLKRGKAAIHDNVVLKLFDEPSTYSVLVFDKDIFVYPYGYQKLGNESPAFHFRNDGTNRSQFYLDIAKSIIAASSDTDEDLIESWRREGQ